MLSVKFFQFEDSFSPKPQFFTTCCRNKWLYLSAIPKIMCSTSYRLFSTFKGSNESSANELNGTNKLILIVSFLRKEIIVPVVQDKDGCWRFNTVPFLLKLHLRTGSTTQAVLVTLLLNNTYDSLFFAGGQLPRSQRLFSLPLSVTAPSSLPVTHCRFKY